MAAFRREQAAATIARLVPEIEAGLAELDRMLGEFEANGG